MNAVTNNRYTEGWRLIGKQTPKPKAILSVSAHWFVPDTGDPIEGRELASQPTLSRFENGVGVKELYRVGEFLAESVIRRHAQRLRHRAYRVTIDLDPTDDPTHGAQQLSFFNGHYDTWCYLPVMGFVSFNDEAEQYLCAAVLRPGNVTAAVGAVALLRRLVRMIRHHLPGVQIRIR